ncbi:hypothetical protein [Shinella sp. HZN7]|uniref:hypothetical protein n=1 Tax=Shinella sp. (strain HZN7) TaxID=879274 RepID=UPI0011AB7205|nr:hypothetical protein [Shinella sp. HZN7]
MLVLPLSSYRMRAAPAESQARSLEERLNAGPCARNGWPGEGPTPLRSQDDVSAAWRAWISEAMCQPGLLGFRRPVMLTSRGSDMAFSVFSIILYKNYRLKEKHAIFGLPGGKIALNPAACQAPMDGS